jgi:putative acetyltransferase
VSMRIEVDTLHRPEVRRLLADHLAEMHATSPPESVHALDLEALTAPDVTVWTLWEEDIVQGCAALLELSPAEGEIKSMRTAPSARGRGIAGRMLEHLIAEAQRRGYRRLSLETGAAPYFAPALRLYARHGFVECPPFGDYAPDSASVFMLLEL